MSEDERHTTRHNGRRRRVQTATGGLGKWQRHVLLWLWQEERRILEAGTPKQRAALKARGVPYSQKKVLGKGEVTASERGSLSRALRSLDQSDRRLVITSGSSTGNRHTKYVQLTQAARDEAARLERDDLMTADQVKRREQALQEYPSRTAQNAVRADAVLLDILRLYLTFLREEQTLEGTLIWKRTPRGGTVPEKLLKVWTHFDVWREIRSETPAAADSALSNLTAVVRMLKGAAGLEEHEPLRSRKAAESAEEEYRRLMVAELEESEPMRVKAWRDNLNRIEAELMTDPELAEAVDAEFRRVRELRLTEPDDPFT